MTLWTLALGYLPVAVVFLVAARLAGRRLTRGVLLQILLESLGLTLIGALWFGSLGRGGWLTLFLLLGLVAATIERGTQTAFPRSALPREAFLAGLAVARFVAGGGLLAWLLG